MAQKKRKTIHYLRALRKGKQFNLQELLADAKEKKPTIAETEILSADEVLRVQRSSPLGNPTFFHITRYFPGEKAPTLTPKIRAAVETFGVQEAPTGMEFKEGECFFLVQDHHVLFLSNGITAARATDYMSLLFQSCSSDTSLKLFSLSPVANTGQLELIQQQGVKSIKLATNAYNLSIPKKKRNNWFSKTLGKFGDEIKSLVEKDESAAEQRAAEDLIVNLELRLDGNTRASDDAKILMKTLAEGILDGDDKEVLEGFSILTCDGASINASEIRLHKPHDFLIANKNVNFESAQKALQAYFEELQESNLLEQ